MIFERSSGLLVLTLFLLLPVEAALFPKKSVVKHIGRKEFQNALKEEHCQRMVPELTRAANALQPLVPVYAVDCDDEKNKPLCAEEGVQGFPTIKLYPEGKKMEPLVFEGTRTASSFFYWASRAVPGSKIFRGQNVEDINKVVRKNSDKTKIVLLNKTSKTPLLWRALAQKYGNDIMFGNCRDRKGKVSIDMGFEATEKKYKVIIYPPGVEIPFLYDSVMKFNVLSEFFEGIINGTVNLDEVREESLAKQKSEQLAEAESVTSGETKPEISDGLEDETLIDESGYGGFNPHEGVDLEHLMKLTGGINPHAAHGARADAKKNPVVDHAKDEL
ncbi:hypothetical protein Clacol_005780 [Clathrus columnatus]|uniref:Thioredoxin domain-containing protein n=1 Tax=Clathrus columnatus TaxID=1419009 RepID=A0AAV5AEZ0_9AGAM|nr:hypothetical protein Clacol_005780 [Clathrus columnatus]